MDESREIGNAKTATWWAWGALAVASVVLIGFRLHAFDVPLETDECNYAYIGGRLLAGDRLYTDVWDHQPPGIFVLFASAMILFGDAPHVFRYMALAFSLLSLTWVFGLTRRWAGAWAAAFAAFLFAVASADPGTAGEGCNREIYMTTLLLAAWWCVAAAPSADGWRVFVGGLLLGLASTLKTNVAVHWVFLVPWLAWTSWRHADEAHRIRSVIHVLMLFAAGPVALWLLISMYFSATGRGNEFVDAVFLFNLGYSGVSRSFGRRFLDFFTPQRHPFTFDSALPLWIGGAVAALALLLHTIHRKAADDVPLLLLLAASYAAVCLPAHFWPHYYFLMIPALTMVIPLAVHRLVPAHRRGAFLGVGVLAVFLVALVGTEYRHYLSQPPPGITVKRYNSRDFWGRAQGENVARVIAPDDEVFVFGNDAEIYYYSNRRCASRYTMITGLQEGYPGARDRRTILLDELRGKPPRLILILFDEQPFEGWLEFLDEHYGEAVGVDFHDKRRSAIMLVFARRDAPIPRIDWDWDRSSIEK